MFSDGSGYEQLIPRQFGAATLVGKHTFGVWRPWHAEVRILLTKNRELEVVPPSAFCGLDDGGQIFPFVIEIEKHPSQANAVMELGHAMHTGPRAMRYINLYKAYEIVCPSPDIRYSAVRHSLAHATHSLNRTKTVNELLATFGSKEIDLSIHRHERIFWQRFGELLVLVDSLLRVELEKIRSCSLFRSDHVKPMTQRLAEYYFPDQLHELLSNNSFKPKPLRGSA